MNKEENFLLSSIKELDFKLYKLTQEKTLFFKKKYLIEELTPEESGLEHVHWKFNDQYFGEYCRDIEQTLGHIENQFRFSYGNARGKLFEEISKKIDFIKYNDLKDKDRILSRLEHLKLPNFHSLNIVSLFEFRNTSFNKFKSAIEEDFNNFPEGFMKEGIYFKLKSASERQIPFSAVGFCWNKARDLTKDMVILHSYLCSNGFIHKDTPISDLKHAFNCTFIETPLNIQWVKKVKGKVSKGLLFHFVDQLEHFNLITVTLQNLALFNKIMLIFTDPRGMYFDNLAVSKSQWLNQRKSENTHQELELDSILYKLFYNK